jgi:DNA (cytosine-5)-methyltransferase 1
MMYEVLDLFSGIGGFSLGLERTGGFKTVAFCEIEPFCQAVLKKHWPEVPCYDDITTLTAERLAAEGIRPNVLCGGFPCQDISVAGKGAGLEGKRSGLWREYARLIGEIRPRFAIVENVAALLGRGLGRVLGDLAALRYDAEWHCIPASHVGAEHGRDRIWIIAYLDETWELQSKGRKQDQRRRLGNSTETNASYPHGTRLQRRRETRTDQENVGIQPPRLRFTQRAENPIPRNHWDHQPLLGGRLHGVPNRLDRIGALGNTVYPEIPQIIGEAILRASA